MNRLFLTISLSVMIPSAFAQESSPTPPQDQPYKPSPSLNATSSGDDNLEVFAPATEESMVEEAPSKEPNSKAASVPDTYNIQRGDTLWDICQKLLDNPWYWPKLWSLNEFISNPHLISPGDKVVFVSGGGTSMPRMDVVKAEEGPPQEISVQNMPKVPEEPEVFDQLTGNRKSAQIKLKPIAFISEHELKTAGKISHSGEPYMELAAGDTVYLDLKNRKDVKVGDRFHVIRVIKEVNEPGSFFGGLGELVRRNAVVQVRKIYPRTVEGMITDCDDSVNRNDRVIPYQSPIRTVVPHLAKKDLSGLIVEAENEQYMVSNNDMVYLNLGSKDGVEDGTQLFVVRRGDGVFPGDDEDLPDVIIGKLLVVETREKVSTAYVTDLKDHLIVGDRVRNKAD